MSALLAIEDLFDDLGELWHRTPNRQYLIFTLSISENFVLGANMPDYASRANITSDIFRQQPTAVPSSNDEEMEAEANRNILAGEYSSAVDYSYLGFFE